MEMRAFEFRREGDGAVYRFEPVPGEARWKRRDIDLWCIRLPHSSWAIVDASGERLGWPLEQRSQTDTPPEGRWISRKDGKSYIYTLAFV